jgi:hypothetical protein
MYQYPHFCSFTPDEVDPVVLARYERIGPASPELRT